MKVLVTGGSGFIGTNLRNLLAQSNRAVQNYDFVEGKDIRNAPQISDFSKDVDAIVHLAALVRVAECELKPRETLETNLIGTQNVLEAARMNDINNLVFASSAAIYGVQDKFPIPEDAKLNPCSIYAYSKIAAEELIDLYRKSYGLTATCLRIFNVFGQGQDSKLPYAAAIPIFIERALKGQDLVIYGRGKQTRDFIYVKDVAEAIALALDKKPNQTLNLASGKDISVLDIAETIKKLANSKSEIKFEQPRAGDIQNSCADITKLKLALGFSPKYGLEDGLKETIKWFEKKN